MDHVTNITNAPSLRAGTEKSHTPEHPNHLRRRVAATVAGVALLGAGLFYAGEAVVNRIKHNNQQLTIPAPDSRPLIYKVQDGDTSASVAEHFRSNDGNHLEQLMDLVHREEVQLHPDGAPMQPGDVISVPHKQGDTTFTQLTEDEYKSLHNGIDG